jgi:glycosyltransferase involved in cell wall biosynthesis
MQAADVFAMTSRWEGLPLVLLEAMAAGLPAVAYGIPGVLEVISDSETGIIVKEMNPESLAQALSRILDDPGLRETWGQASQDRVSREFSFATTMDSIVEIYEQVAKGERDKRHA